MTRITTLIAAVPLVLSACSPPPPAPPEPSLSLPVESPEPVDMSPQELAAMFGASVWRVDVEYCGMSGSGSAFVLAPEVLVTNAHVLEYADKVSVSDRTGMISLPAEVIGSSDVVDVALLRVPGLTGAPLSWVAASELAEGQQLVSLGFPSPLNSFSVTPGTLNAFLTEEGIRTGIVSDDASDFGSSGGPLLTLSGSVAGIVTEFLGGTQLSGVSLSYESVQAELDAISAGLREVSLGCVGPDEREVVSLLSSWCLDGQFWACDLMLVYAESDEEYELAASCGFRLDTDLWCAEVYDSPVPTYYGDMPALDRIQDDCMSSDPYAPAACDVLLQVSPSGSDYEYVGYTCGERVTEDLVDERWCEERFWPGP